jgi:hypothetical protein
MYTYMYTTFYRAPGRGAKGRRRRPCAPRPGKEEGGVHLCRGQSKEACLEPNGVETHHHTQKKSPNLQTLPPLGTEARNQRQHARAAARRIGDLGLAQASDPLHRRANQPMEEKIQ